VPPSAAERARRAEATTSNLRLGHDIRAALADPTDDHSTRLREIVCRLLCRHHPDVIAYGAGWTDPARQQPVGDTGRHEPRHIDAIVDAELQRALDDPDPLRGIAQLVARWAAAFVLDPDGAPAPRRWAPHRARALERRQDRGSALARPPVARHHRPRPVEGGPFRPPPRGRQSRAAACCPGERRGTR
jgi:hypothetical protein